jgi:formate hydrogenlyase subunit 4
MSFLVAFLGQVLHIALLVAAAPSLAGYMDWLHARLTGRAGVSWQRPWQNLLRLSRKQPVLAENASALFTAAPLVAFAAVAAAAALVPSFTLGMALAPLADLLVLVGLLALSRCALALAGLDIGTALGGMGASRTVTYACFGEPALLLVIFTLGLLAGSTNLDLVAAMQQESHFGWQAASTLALAATVIVGLVDAEAGPLRGPQQRAELAMLRQAVTLEFSGYSLAAAEATAAFRLLLWLDLIVALFLPFGMASPSAGLTAWPLGLLAWLVKLLILASVLVLSSVLLARFRLPRVPHLLGIATLLALLAAAFLFASTRTV